MIADVPRVILASQSPRRRELLGLIGIPHTVMPADIDESVWPGELPVPHCERLARQKAHTLAVQHPDAVVIAADTIVVLDGEILGKPTDAADARRMVKLLAGRSHTVYTAIAVARGGRTESAVEEVGVTFRALSEAEIAAYVATQPAPRQNPRGNSAGMARCRGACRSQCGHPSRTEIRGCHPARRRGGGRLARGSGPRDLEGARR